MSISITCGIVCENILIYKVVHFFFWKEEKTNINVAWRWRMNHAIETTINRINNHFSSLYEIVRVYNICVCVCISRAHIWSQLRRICSENFLWRSFIYGFCLRIFFRLSLTSKQVDYLSTPYFMPCCYVLCTSIYFYILKASHNFFSGTPSLPFFHSRSVLLAFCKLKSITKY